MSNKNTFVISNEHNRVIHYRKNSPPGNKAKSGIIERYTYKSDNGELLPSTSFETNMFKTKNSGCVQKFTTKSMPGSSSSTQCAVTKIPESTSIRSNLPQLTDKILGRNKNSTNSNKFSSKNTVRTEHCDSTTDVDMIVKYKNMLTSKQSGHESDESSEYEGIKYNLVSHKSQPLETNDDSDSDCQIVDIKPLDLPVKRKTIIQQVDWVLIPNKNTEIDTVQVISDSESEGSDLQSNTLTSSLIPDKTTNNVSDRTKTRELLTYTSEDSYDGRKDDSLEPSIYEISDGIQIVLPPKENHSKNSELVLLSNVEHKKSLTKTKSQVQNELTKPKSYESDENPDVTSSEMLLRDQHTPTMKQDKFTSDNTMINNKSPKYDFTLSPESMKTEFYSYLKINTNPLAPKAETVAQNRRSVRVKNLIVQNEKLKEKLEQKKKEQKLDDVRNKFLQYKSNIKFPSLDQKNNISMDFDDYIIKYFVKERIDYKNTEKNKNLKVKTTSNNKIFKVSTLDIKNSSYDRKKLYKKIFMKQTNNKTHENLKHKNKENVYIKQKSLLKQKKLLKHKKELKRLGANRVLRNRRVTRQSLLSNTNKKLIKPTKLKNTKKKTTPIQSKELPKRDLKLELKNLRIELNPLDQLDLLTKTVMSEFSMQQNEDSDSQISNPSFKVQINKSNDQTTERESDDELSEINSGKPSSSESCLGFYPDENIHKIRKNMESVLSNIIINPLEKLEEVLRNEIHTDMDYEINNETPNIENEKNIQENSSKSVASGSEISHDFEENITDYENKERYASPEIFNSETIKNIAVQNYIPLNPNVSKKSFHHTLLLTPKRRSNESPNKNDQLYMNSMFSLSDSEENESPKSIDYTKKSQTHAIDIQKLNGPVFNAYYVNCTLIIVQELLISFWKQTPLGNVLGAQNMWYSVGNIKRLTLETNCINRRSSEMVLNVDSSVAYIELWTKEHQSDYRERPIADVFATVYFHRGQGSPDKKVLQLENIKGYGNDVRFAVMKNSREIVVSWFETFSEPAKATIRSYQLAPDFQTIYSTKELESVEHFILSLHNIENCDTLVLGAGSDQLCVWNLTHGWLTSTVSFAPSSSQIHSMCLYAHCETGYLFLLQQIGRGILRLIAINGVSSQWKQLQIYHVPEGYESLLGVTIESGILLTCYTNGFLCFDMQSGELLADTETPLNRIILPSDKFLVSLDDYKVSVKHVMVYVLEN